MIVVGLEGIDVEHDDRQRRALALGAAPLHGQPVIKLPAVGHAGQAVQKSHVAQKIGLKFERQVGFDPRAHHAGVDGLADEIHRTGVQALRFNLVTPVRGDKNDRNARGVEA